MKKIIIFFFLVFLSSCTFFGKEKIENKSEGGNVKVEKNINLNNKNNNKWNLIKETETINIKKECNKVIKWEKSEYLSNTKLYNEYLKSLQVLKKNEYKMIIEMKKWNCLTFFWKNKNFCESIKTKKIVGKKWEYDYSLSKSIIEWKNYCDLIKNKDLVGDCNETFKYFMETKIDINNIKLSDDIFKKWKFLLEVWKGKYKKIIDDLFLKQCLNFK